VLRHLLDRDAEFSAAALHGHASDWYLRTGDSLRSLHHARAAQDPGRVRAALLGGALAATVVETGALGDLDDAELATVLAHPVGAADVAAEQALALAALVPASERYARAEVDRLVHRVLATDAPGETQQALALRSAVLEIQARAHFWSFGDGQSSADLLAEAVRAAQSAGATRAEVRSRALLELVDSVRLDSGGGHFAERPREREEANPQLAHSAVHHLAEVIRASVRLDLPSWSHSLERAEDRWSASPRERADPAVGWSLVVMRSWLSLESGAAPQARTELMALEPDVPRLPPLVMAARLQILAEIETALGRPQSALNLLRGSPAARRGPWLAIAAARAYLTQERPVPADRLLHPMLANADATADPILVTALLLSARSHQLQGAEDFAERQVRRALALAGDDIRSPFARTGVMLGGLLDRRPALRRSWPAVPRADGGWPRASPSVRPELATSLSPRELALLRRLGARMTNAEIARELVLSPNTVKSRLAALYQKLGAGNRTEAVATARQRGLL
jgi:DNA-binding CsgD family transcriptional regulator